MDIEALFEEKPEPEVILEPALTPESATEPAAEAQRAPEPAPEPKPAEPVRQDDDKRVPLATFLDARDEAKELKRQVAEYKAKAEQAAPPEMPDPYDDPQGFASWQTGQVNQALTAQRFEMSDVLARQTHGAETVEAAAKWATAKAQADPYFAQTYMSNSHPLEWIVQQHKRDGLANEIGDDPDAYVRRRAAELGLLPAPTPAAMPVAQQPASTTPEPPRSLAGQPGKGGLKDVATGPLSAVHALFQG